MKTTKRSLWSASAAIALTFLLLAGATFAWFTDSVTSGGNKIQAGNLSISATVQSVDADKTDFTIDGVNGGEPFGFADEAEDLSAGPIISEELWEPGQSNAKLLTVTNDGSLAAKIKLQFNATDKGLEDALWFDFIQIVNGTASGTFTERPMSSLAALGEAREFSLGAGEAVSFILVYGMDEEAGNEYQGKTFEADATILAKQDTVEKDGFGNDDYDAQAPYETVTASDLKDSIAAGGSVVLGDDVVIAPDGEEVTDGSVVPQMTVTNDVTLNLNDKELELDANATTSSLPYVPALIAVEDGTLTLTGDGTVNAEAGYNTAYGINVKGGTVVINGGTYYGAMSAVQVQQGKLEINGGFFDLASTIKAAAPQYVTYLINCIDAEYKDGSAIVEIKGGTFVNFDPSNNAAEGEGTNFLAAGYKVVSEKHGTETWYTVVPE